MRGVRATYLQRTSSLRLPLPPHVFPKKRSGRGRRRKRRKRKDVEHAGWVVTRALGSRRFMRTLPVTVRIVVAP